MGENLYEQLIEVEKRTKEFSTLSPSTHVNVPELERALLDKYKDNPVLLDAIHKRQSIESSLLELARVCRPVRRLFPRRKNKAHNERLEQIGKLVGYPRHLKTSGILLGMDNFVGGVAFVAALAYSTAYFYPYLFNQEASSEYHLMCEAIQTSFPPLMTLLIGPVFGLGLHIESQGYLPLKEARYLDRKVREFYEFY